MPLDYQRSRSILLSLDLASVSGQVTSVILQLNQDMKRETVDNQATTTK